MHLVAVLPALVLPPMPKIPFSKSHYSIHRICKKDPFLLSCYFLFGHSTDVTRTQTAIKDITPYSVQYQNADLRLLSQ